MHKIHIITLTAIIAVGALWFSLLPPPQKDTGSTTPSPTVRPERYSLHLGLNIGEGSALHAASIRLAEQLAEKSNRRIKLTVHPNQELGNDHQMVEMARNGELDMVLTPTAKLSIPVPAMQYADLPFYFNSRQELYAMLDGEPGELLLSKLNAIGLVGIAFWENGFKHFTANQPILSPEDFQGLRFRTMKSRIIMDQFTSLGATPLPIDFHATYQALADGVVDGQENPLVAIAGMKFHEVQSHLTLSSHAYLGYVFSISAKTLASLPMEIRQLIHQTIHELTLWERQETQRREAEFLAQIQKAGVTIHQLTAGQRHAFQQALNHMPDRFESVIGTDLLAITEELRWANLPAEEKQQTLLLGLNADLSANGTEAGSAILRGMKLAAEEINRDGGILGKRLRILARNHSGIPSRGVHNIWHFASLPNLVAMMGGMDSVIASAELGEIHSKALPFLLPWATDPNLTDNSYEPNYIFRLSASDAEATPTLLAHAAKGRQRIGVLLERSSWGRSNEALLNSEAAKDDSLQLVIKWFNRGDQHFLPLINQLHESGAEALLIMANATESAHIIRAMALRDRKLPIYAHWGLTGGQFWDQVKTELETVTLHFLQSANLFTPGTPKLNSLMATYHNRYNQNPDEAISTPMGFINAYQLTHLLADAIRKAGSSERYLIRNALEQLPAYQGLMQHHSPPTLPQRHGTLNSRNLILSRFDASGHIIPSE
jgi:tripartite ATP-independent transporter DctP family solute receptor